MLLFGANDDASFRVDGGQSFRQGAIFQDTIYEKKSKIPIYTGFELDDENIKSMGMTKEFEELFREYAAVGQKDEKKESKL